MTGVLAVCRRFDGRVCGQGLGVLGGILLEILQAALAAELHLLALVDKDVWFAHAAELFTGNEASL
jgi:hypothetical protein